MIKPVKTTFNAFMMLFLLIGCQPTEEKSGCPQAARPQEKMEEAQPSSGTPKEPEPEKKWMSSS